MFWKAADAEYFTDTFLPFVWFHCLLGDNWNTFSEPRQYTWSALWWQMSFHEIMSNRCERAEWVVYWNVLWMPANCILLLPTLTWESHAHLSSLQHVVRDGRPTDWRKLPSSFFKAWQTVHSWLGGFIPKSSSGL